MTVSLPVDEGIAWDTQFIVGDTYISSQGPSFCYLLVFNYEEEQLLIKIEIS